jgi:hypothetical protein
MRALSLVSLALVLVPAVASAQSLVPSVSVQAAAGPTVVDSGHHVSAAVGFSPMPRVTLFLDVQRTQLSSRITHHERGSSSFRGGTMTAVSGEVRVSLWPARRVTPYVLGGLGAGVSRPTVNEVFPDPITNDARFFFFGGGVHVPLRDRLSVFGDVRLLAGGEGRNGTLAILPVRVGIGWRF